MATPIIVKHELKDNVDALETDLLAAMKAGDIERATQFLEKGAVLIDFPEEEDLEKLKSALDKHENVHDTSNLIIEKLLENGTPEDIVQLVAEILKINIKKSTIEESKPHFAEVSKQTIFRDSLRLMFFQTEYNKTQTEPHNKHNYVTEKNSTGLGKD